MSYVKTVWVNGSTPAINATNLNKIENELETLDTNLIPNYKLVTSLTEWNVEYRAGSTTPALTLPTPPTDTSAEIRYTFTAATTSASFTAPSGYILTDDSTSGLSAGNTVTLTSLTAGSEYEVSFAVVSSTGIKMIYKEWPTT